MKTNKTNKPNKQHKKSKSDKSKNSQSDDFKRYTEGMSFDQKREYLLMSDAEKIKVREKIDQIEKEKDKLEKEKNREIKNIKIIKKGKEQICVMVLNMRGQPLMPTSPRKARILLKEKKAKVVQRCPFTIQLKYATGENKQPIKLGLDPGYKFVGFSATTDKREIISGEVILRTDIPDRLKEKAMYRRGRRNRNTRYRKARFDNRLSWKEKEGWLAPSIRHKLDTYVRLVKRFEKMLPVTDINVEVSPFDTQKMMNPEITGIEYQQGTLQGYEVREYLLEKFHRKCVYCKKENVPFETEHIIPTSRGGTNRISNLAIACHDCNQKKGSLTAAEFGHPEIQTQAKQSLKAATFMNIVRSRLVNNLKSSFPEYNIDMTYGYITKYNRINLLKQINDNRINLLKQINDNRINLLKQINDNRINLLKQINDNRIKIGIEKSHANDAFVISTLRKTEKDIENIIRSRPYQVQQIRRNNRALQMNRKGSKPYIRRQRYKYSSGDLMVNASSLTIEDGGWGDKINKKDRVIYTSRGVFNYGKSIRLKNPILGEKDLSPNINKVRLLKYGAGLLFQLQQREIENNKNMTNNQINTKTKQNDIETTQRGIDDAW